MSGFVLEMYVNVCDIIQGCCLTSAYVVNTEDSQDSAQKFLKTEVPSVCSKCSWIR